MGVATPGVEVGFLGDNPPFPAVMTNGSGYYRFSNVATEPVSLWPMYAFLDGVNYVEEDVQLVTGGTVQHDWNMTSPLMVITPAVLEETMNPNEWRSVPITITNGPTGGPLHWTAEIIFGEPPTMAGLAKKVDQAEWTGTFQNTNNAEASILNKDGSTPAPYNVTAYMESRWKSLLSVLLL
jgi:hypothetical protein